MRPLTHSILLAMKNNLLHIIYSLFVSPFIFRVIQDDDDSMFDAFSSFSCNREFDYASERFSQDGERIPCTLPVCLRLESVRVLPAKGEQKMPSVILFFNDPADPYAVSAKFVISFGERQLWTLTTASKALGVLDAKRADIALASMKRKVGEPVWVVVDQPEDPSWNPSVNFTSCPEDLSVDELEKIVDSEEVPEVPESSDAEDEGDEDVPF